MQTLTMSDHKTNINHNAGPKVLIDSIVTAITNQIGCELGEEQVILDLDSGVYYGLGEVASNIWKLIQTPIKVEVVRDTLLEQYEIDAASCERDLLAFLEVLAERRLIRVHDETAA